MSDFIESLIYRWRFIAASALIVGCILLLPLLMDSIGPTAHASAADSSAGVQDTSMENSPNVITSSMFRAVDKLNRSASLAGQSLSNGFQSVSKSVTKTTTHSGKFVTKGLSAGLSGLGDSLNFIADGAGSGVSFAAHATGDAVGLITKNSVVSAVIRPKDNTPVPVIDTDPAQEAAIADIIKNNGIKSPQSQAGEKTMWPIHGEITTEFGVPEPPYQAIHTGIDISDGHLGVTAVHPFRSGVVIQIIRSSQGLGNHVIVDHGGGITSVYGHLAAISVTAGQKVDQTTTLGLEGSTGVSTGAHVHFEIRLNGAPVNPHNYISGQS
jgi:murein DD-endopeptidase MepM/ murein hydrolase activator NlpD